MDTKIINVKVMDTKIINVLIGTQST